MPDIAITNIVLPTKLTGETLLLGETCAAFDIVYKDANGKYLLASATDPLKTKTTHILLQGGVLDVYVIALPLRGSLGLTGPTLVVGTRYVVSAANAGKMAPKSDLVTTNLISEVFIASAANTALMDLNDTGIAMP